MFEYWTDGFRLWRFHNTYRTDIDRLWEWNGVEWELALSGSSHDFNQGDRCLVHEEWLRKMIRNA